MVLYLMDIIKSWLLKLNRMILQGYSFFGAKEKVETFSFKQLCPEQRFYYHFYLFCKREFVCDNDIKYENVWDNVLKANIILIQAKVIDMLLILIFLMCLFRNGLPW